MLFRSHWWKDVRPLRPDPHDASGWSDWCNQRRAEALARAEPGDTAADLAWIGGDDETPKQRMTSTKLANLAHQIERDYEEEDEQMMIRLIRVRHALWT